MQIAQTNLQLYNQLLLQSRGAEELSEVRRAYELAMQLFSSKYRATGKPFLSHLVGTASLLAWIEQSVTVIMAGLLHASFDAGDFADGNTGLNKARQLRMEQAVPSKVVAIVTAYHQLSRHQAIEMLRGTVPIGNDPLLRHVLLIHLCDTVEEYSDSGMIYAPQKAEFLVDACGGDIAKVMVEAFSRLGFASYGPDLIALFDSWQRRSLPADLISTRNGSFVLPPSSYQERTSVTLRKAWYKFHLKLSRTLSRNRRLPAPKAWSIKP